MDFVQKRGSSSGASGLLLVPGSNLLDFDLDLDDDDEDVVIGIRPKSSPQPRRKTSVEEEESDISEPPSLSGTRRVSFADAVGLNLVQVKEFDKWDIPLLPNFLDVANKDDDDYFISPFNFSLPFEESLPKVLEQKVDLESVELLPGTTILKGVIRVLNISFTKAVYVRTSLDNWVSHFDLLAEFVPGSSDGHSDSFAFKLTLVPPFAEQGARVDFCVRYETPNGTFWDNNNNKNYVVFCHKRRKEDQDKPQKENVSKKSCLKTASRSVSGKKACLLRSEKTLQQM
ncbi:hypothetical protein WMY93_023577 [Mugilogobius chulae]|uniref:CBM21 domain-containing protein n=1 Tax=Mugilogobius chulae TaxID=88201 RepID=A0AAW0N4M5_9GOBI